MKAESIAPNVLRVEGTGNFRVINLYMPPHVQGRRRVKALISQVKRDYTSARVEVIDNEDVGVGTVGFDMHPVYQLLLHRYIHDEVDKKEPLWEKLLNWVGL